MNTVSNKNPRAERKETKEWRDVIQNAYQTAIDLQSKLEAGVELTGDQRRSLRAAQSLTRKYHLSGRKKVRSSD